MYNDRGNLRFLAGAVLVIVLLFFVILLIMRHGGDTKSKVPTTKETLTSYATNPSVTIRETIIGPIVAEQDHSQMQIDVTSQTTTAQLSKGYDNNVVGSKSYGMTESSFSEFLNALDKAGFTKGDTNEKLKDDRGYCATGNRYIFEVLDAGRRVQRFWATSCSGPKTYKGNLGSTIQLFRNQVPEYDDLVSDANLSSGSLL